LYIKSIASQVDFFEEKKRILKKVGINVFVRPKVTRTKTLITHIY